MSLLVFLAQTIRIAIPYLFAAAGGVVAERAGVISLTLEGFMLTGAFTATLGAFYSGNPWVGVLCGILGGLLFGLLHGVATIRYRADQVVSGIAINLFAVGITRFFLQLAFDSSSNSPRVPGFTSTPSDGSLLTGLLGNPLIWLGLLVIPVLSWVVYRTPFGLRVRAVGEHAQAAETLGVSVKRVRYVAVALSGALAALGGVYLALDQHQFTDGMSAGRGFIALAAIIFGRWDPARAGVACLLFAAAETLQIQLQGTQLIPSQFVQMIPYALTIVALAGVVGRAVPPAALGKAE
ncbi:MAG TPA: ABC transporter permease [Gemmatimonadaceae bacterium]|nr:ABC transporter permease [Gemmatimonadaceae bacterium]